MNKLFNKVNRGDFQSSSGPTEEWNAWYKSFVRYFKKVLKDSCHSISFSKNHFCLSGFLTTRSGKIYYFSVSDVRHSLLPFMIRTATSYKDYKGGVNHFIRFNDEFETELLKYIGENNV